MCQLVHLKIYSSLALSIESIRTSTTVLGTVTITTRVNRQKTTTKMLGNSISSVTNAAVTIFVNDNVKIFNITSTATMLYTPKEYHCGGYVEMSDTTIVTITNTITLILNTEESDIVAITSTTITSTSTRTTDDAGVSNNISDSHINIQGAIEQGIQSLVTGSMNNTGSSIPLLDGHAVNNKIYERIIQSISSRGRNNKLGTEASQELTDAWPNHLKRAKKQSKIWPTYSTTYYSGNIAQQKEVARSSKNTTSLQNSSTLCSQELYVESLYCIRKQSKQKEEKK